MATVFDVAKYILDKYGSMSTMKLQKLTFYCQAMSLVWDDVPIFEEEFEAWAKGPVCRELFNVHKGKFMLTDSNLFDGLADTTRLTADNIETIDAVVDGLIERTPRELSAMTHQESPWINARNNSKMGAYCQAIIPKDDMQEYYAANW